MAILGSKGPVKRIGVLGLGKQEESALTPAALEALGIEVPCMYTNLDAINLDAGIARGCVYCTCIVLFEHFPFVLKL